MNVRLLKWAAVFSLLSIPASIALGQIIWVPGLVAVPVTLPLLLVLWGAILLAEVLRRPKEA